uniref:NNMT/PNMT/TEMT family protein n=1 Tax=Caenorhabditis tropicalis TaxID=1561998 RepID=A0A1I7UUS3_9PELO
MTGTEKEERKEEEEEKTKDEECAAIDHRDKSEITRITTDYKDYKLDYRSSFDWDNVCKWIANIEASMETGTQMQEKTRKLMRAVLDVNVHESPVVQSVVWKENESVEVPEKFQVVSTVFCLEYSCETLEGYFRAVRNACSLIEDGGFLIQGGVLDATTYNFGGKTFRCHRLKQTHILESLKANGMATTAEQGYKFITHDDIFLLVSKKI